MPTTSSSCCNGARSSVDADVERGESLLNVLRERLGIVSAQGRVRAAGAVRMLHGARRRRAARRVRDAGRARRGPSGDDDRRTRRRHARRVPRRRSSRPADRSAGSARPGIIMRFAGHAGARRRPLARRAPVPVHRLADGARRGRAAARRWRLARDLDAAASARAALEAGGPQHVGLDVPLGGASFADDTAPRDALVAVPLPPGSARGIGRGRGHAVGRGRVAARGAGPRREGAGPAHDRRRPRRRCSTGCRRARRAACSSRRVGRARVPRTRRVVVRAGRRTRVAARERRRVRRQGAFAAPRRPRASSPTTSGARCASSTRGEDVVRLGPKRPPIAAVAVARDGVVEIDGVIVARRRPAARLAAPKASKCARAGPRSTSRVRR